MIPRELSPVPAIIRPVQDDLVVLAQQINAEHEAGEGATRKGLEHFRRAGEALIRAKAACPRGQWLKWLKKNVQFSQANAYRYVQIAREWEKVIGAINLEQALRLLTKDVPAPEPEPEPSSEHSDLIFNWVQQVTYTTYEIATERGGIKGLLAEPNKWDWEDIRERVLPMLDGLRRTVDEFYREIEAHDKAQQDGDSTLSGSR